MNTNMGCPIHQVQSNRAPEVWAWEIWEPQTEGQILGWWYPNEDNSVVASDYHNLGPQDTLDDAIRELLSDAELEVPQ